VPCSHILFCVKNKLLLNQMIFNKNLLISALLFLSLALDAQKKTVKLELTYYEPYCGGARPTDEILAEAQKPKPYAGQKVILLSKTGKTDTLITDIKGKLTLKLKKGEYSIFEAWRYYKKSFNSAPLDQFDQACLKNEWEKATVEITVGRKKTNIKFKNDLMNYCEWAIPCLLESHAPPMRE